MNKIVWVIPFTIIILGVSFGLYASGLTTTLTTPNLNQTCDPISQKLVGYDSSGVPVCAPDNTGNGSSSSGIYLLLTGKLSSKSFITTSSTYVATGFPVNGTFTKHFANSQLWINMVMDDRNTCNDVTNYARIYVDGNKGLNWAHPSGLANTVSAYSYFEQIGASVGTHTISVDVATNGCTATFQTDIAQLQVYEVLLS